MFTSDQWMSFVRHLLTWGGGILIAKGLMTQGIVNESIGALMTLAGVAWSFLTHSMPPDPSGAVTAAAVVADIPPRPAPSVSQVAITPPPDNK